MEDHKEGHRTLKGRNPTFVELHRDVLRLRQLQALGHGRCVIKEALAIHGFQGLVDFCAFGFELCVLPRSSSCPQLHLLEVHQRTQAGFLHVEDELAVGTGYAATTRFQTLEDRPDRLLADVLAKELKASPAFLKLHVAVLVDLQTVHHRLRLLLLLHLGLPVQGLLDDPGSSMVQGMLHLRRLLCIFCCQVLEGSQDGDGRATLQFGLVVGEQVLAKVARAGILQEHCASSERQRMRIVADGDALASSSQGLD
mmetsp:Transcript_131414/g.185380  ORF Transcript_131414/g.185380 Transcript_131414/m.185380 type:complete len:254 (-) Transcript_131414:124-885(-)